MTQCERDTNGHAKRGRGTGKTSFLSPDKIKSRDKKKEDLIGGYSETGSSAVPRPLSSLPPGTRTKPMSAKAALPYFATSRSVLLLSEDQRRAAARDPGLEWDPDNYCYRRLALPLLHHRWPATATMGRGQEKSGARHGPDRRLPVVRLQTCISSPNTRARAHAPARDATRRLTVTGNNEDLSLKAIEIVRNLQRNAAARCETHGITLEDAALGSLHASFDIATRLKGDPHGSIEWLRTGLDVIERQLMEGQKT